MRLFKIGDLVKLSPLLDGPNLSGKVNLMTYPPELISFSNPNNIAIPTATQNSKNTINAIFHKSDVGIVIAFEHMDRRSVFVLCSTGCGWVPGAFLLLA
jgi:hypothetical protein